MTVSDPRLRSLLRQARAVAAANKRAAAQQLYREILDEFPESPQAWLGLAPLLDTPHEQRQAVQRALDLDPDNEAAKVWLGSQDGSDPAQEQEVEAPDAAGALPDVTPARSIDEAFADARRYLDEATAREPVRPVDEPPSTEDARTGIDGDAPGDAGAVAEPEAAEVAVVLTCANHPNRETTLRCNRCGKPVCTQCIKLTPVGYRCKECVREQEDVFFTAGAVQYVVAFAVAAPLAVLFPFLLNLIGGFWFLALFISPVAGTLLGRAVFYAIGRRRGRYIPYLVAALMIGGALLVLLLNGNLLTTGIYAFLAVSSAFYQLR